MKVLTKNNGMVLVVALILMLPLTLIAVAVMQWSREDLKMIGAITDRNSAEQSVIGVMQEVMIINNLAAVLSTMGSTSDVTTGSGHSVALSLRSETTCKRKFNANSDAVIKNCRYVDADSGEMTFAKGGIGALESTLNIEQPLLSNNGG